MPQGSVSLLPFLLLLTGYAMAGLSLWPSLHVALSSASVFVDYSTERDHNSTDGVRDVVLSLVDTDSNATVLTRALPGDRPEGRLELNCSCFLYAGTFRFHLRWTSSIATTSARVNGSEHSRADTTTYRWSPELQVQWPTFHIAVERAGNHSGSFQVGISTNEHFQGCSSAPDTALSLEVSYMEYNQIGRNSIDKVRVRTRHPVAPVRSQSVRLPCAFPFTERDFIRVALRSPHVAQEVKSSGPLYLSRIFAYKLTVDNANAYRTGCEGAMTVKLVTPPCAHINGKVLLYRDGGVATGVAAGLAGTGAGGGTASAGFASEEPPSSKPLAFNWLTQGENETEFNCSVFYPGRNKYCFRFVFNFSRSPSPAQTCLVVHRSTESWGPWLPWSVCSVSCGEGVRERVRECLLPSGVGGLQCTGMVKEQSLCSLEECAVLPQPSPSLPPAAVGGPLLGGNLVAVIGISLCLAVILATILVTVWRKVCQTTPPCSSVRRGSKHSPGGRKLSDEASICGHSLQRPSLSDSQGQQGGGPEKERPPLGCQPLAQPLVVSLPQDPERLSPSGQKLLPPIFGYRLAQQQLKEMKKQGLKEATQLYHVSSSPVNDTLLLDASSAASPAHSPAPTTPIAFSASALSASASVPLGLQEEASLGAFRVAPPFPPEPRTLMVTSRSTPDRLSPRVELVLGPGFGPGGGSSKRLERTADWVEMVERSGLGGLRGGRSETGLGTPHQRCQNFRRALSFSVNDPKPQPLPFTAASRQFRERSMSQVASRTLPEGSCRTKGLREKAPHFPSYPIPEQGVSEWPRANGNEPRAAWVDAPGPCINSQVKHTGTSQVKHMGTSTAAVSAPDLNKPTLLNGSGERARRKSGENWGDSGRAGVAVGTTGIGGPPGGADHHRHPGSDHRAERAEQNWSRRGPSPIQRNILARKLKEAQSCAAAAAAPGHRGRKRSSTFSTSSSERRKARCRSMDYSSSGGGNSGSPYGLSEAEQKMMDLDLSYSG